VEDLASAKDVREDSHPDLIGTVSPGLSALVDSSTPAALAVKASLCMIDCTIDIAA